MNHIILEEINRNVIAIKQELDQIKSYLEEDQMGLTDDVKEQRGESRKRPLSEMKSQKDIEKKFL